MELYSIRDWVTTYMLMYCICTGPCACMCACVLSVHNYLRNIGRDAMIALAVQEGMSHYQLKQWDNTKDKYLDHNTFERF